MTEIIVMKTNWRYWSCAIVTYVMFSSTLCSTLFIVGMTFQRFYSIIQPHKAASFNTVKRTRFVIISIVLFSTLDNIPHLFTSDNKGTNCLPYAKARAHIYGEIHYWVCNFINFFFPCVLLVTMNSIMIHTIRKRSLMKAARSQNQGQIQNSNRKNSEKQTFTMLLLHPAGTSNDLDKCDFSKDSDIAPLTLGYMENATYFISHRKPILVKIWGKYIYEKICKGMEIRTTLRHLRIQ